LSPTYLPFCTAIFFDLEAETDQPTSFYDAPSLLEAFEALRLPLT
jgi:hypothetical protein